MDEEVLDPDLRIIDAHHHLWFIPDANVAAVASRNDITSKAMLPVYRANKKYLLEEYIADISSGHNVRASVFVESHAMYRTTGPQSMRSVGEVEFANGIAAMAASEVYGHQKVCAAIIGGIDLRDQAGRDDALAAHIRAGGGRYRGARGLTIYSDDPNILGDGFNDPRVLSDPEFRSGVIQLGKQGLSCDVLVLEPQLPQVADLARATPETQIVLNHVGAPLGIGSYSGKLGERFADWRSSMRELAGCHNIAVKLGGLGTPFAGFTSRRSRQPVSSQDLASEWRPYIENTIEIFGVQRCMFESNFPVDSAAGSYRNIWNAFKTITAGASDSEKLALYCDTAAAIYRLNADECIVERADNIE